MKFAKNVMACVLAIFMVLISLPTIVLADSTPSNWAVESVEEAKALGLVTNELLNDFSATTTRLEFCRAAVILLRKYGYNVDSITPKMFSDTNDRDVGIAAALGITNGTDTTKNLFSSNDPLTREQAATLLNNVIGVIGRRITSTIVAWTDAVNISNWAVQSASDMYNCGIISGTDTTKLVFSPKTSYTHEQSIVTLLRMWGYINPLNTYNSAGYDPANLRQSQNKVVLADNVQCISATQGVNVLISVDEETRQYTFNNIDTLIRNLNVGDKFVIYPCESVPSGVSIIVSAIEINGNYAIITSNKVSLGDIVKSMDVAQIIPMTSDMVIDYGDGITPVLSTNAQGMDFSSNMINANNINSTPMLYTGLQMVDNLKSVPAITSLSANGSLSVQPLILNVNIPINDSVKIIGNIMVKPTLKADINLHEGWFGIPTGVDYFELSLDNKMQSTLRLEALYNEQIVDMASVYRIQDGTLKQKYESYKMTKAKCDEYRQKLFTSEFPIPTAPGLQATVTWYLKVTASGQISIEAVYTQDNQLGIKFQNGQWSPINTNYTDITVSGAADASIYAGAGIEIGLSYIGVIAATVAPEIGIEVSASTEFHPELINAANTTIKPPHDCVLCIDGDIDLNLSLNANVDAIGLGNLLSQELLRNTTNLGSFYYTLGDISHGVEFGWGVCPYKNGHRYKVFDLNMTWYEAKAYCENLGGHLATITSQEEQDLINTLIKNGSSNFYWLGATDEIIEGDWRWITGEKWGYTNWDSSQPDNHSGIDGVEENYLTLRSNGRWNDLQAIGDSRDSASLAFAGFICEWEQ